MTALTRLRWRQNDARRRTCEPRRVLSRMSNEPLSQFAGALDMGVAELDESGAAQLGLAAAERRQVLVEWNDTRRDYGNDRCLHELFEAQVRASPGPWPWSAKASR